MPINSLSSEFFSLIEKSIQFVYDTGDSTLVRYPHITDWRILPYMVVAHLEYTAAIELEDRTVTVRPGQTVSLPPGLPHSFNKRTRPPAYSHWAHIQCEIFTGISLFHLVEPPLITSGSASRTIGRICQELGQVSAGGTRSLGGLLQRQALGWELIWTLLGTFELKDDQLALVRHASRLTPVLAYIEENLAKPISHELLARMASLSPSRFHVVFRSALGDAPYEYVQKVRLRKAQHLLIRTDHSISEIGHEVGHPDPYHFSRMFRRSFGLSPIHYRRKMMLPSFRRSQEGNGKITPEIPSRLRSRPPRGHRSVAGRNSG